MPTTRAQQLARGEPLNMPENPDNTPATVEEQPVDHSNRPADLRDADEDRSAHPVAAVSMDAALQRTLDRIMERLDEMDNRTSKLEGAPAATGVNREADVALEDAPGRRTPPPATVVANPQPSHSTPLARGTPPHLRAQQQASSPSSPVLKDLPRAREAFRTVPTPQKDVFRKVLARLGTSIPELFDGLIDDENVPDAASFGTVEVANIPAVAVESNDSAASPSSTSRVRQCKPEYLPKFNGDPDGLEKYLTRLHDIIRSDPDPAWERAVLRAFPIQLVDDAEEWHSGLSTDEVRKIDSFDALEEAMRLHFPVNKAEQRRQARVRAWEPKEELSGTYYFAKLRILRAAFGRDQVDSVLVQDIVDGLPATFRALLRLPRGDARLTDLRAEMGEWEPTWREMHPQYARRPVTSISATKTSTTTSNAPASSSTSKPAPAPTSAAPAPSTSATAGAGSSSRPLPLAATYDPARVTPAANGQPRKYRRPGDETVISLNRPCARCGQGHFTFEHQHLVPAIQTLEVDEDTYPVVEDETDASF
ncbi:hypothetical protein A4X13_0g7815 [Tilletia indica]|uniref:Retrotransposon gag domain-containing protein n=1 Tax=Tilletia indica TaxID=43049 RepID=A0A177T4V5_9BASI|nr:hypothetical protein A4X13_0g7815 [Tilletia indica]